MKITYTEGGDDYHFYLETTWDSDSPEYIAQDAALDFYSDHDGWESTWPLQFEIFGDRNSLGKYEIEMEFEPVFTANGITSTN